MRYRYRSEDELKDSGVEWIGKVPKDWKVSKLKNLVTIVTGNTPSKNDEDNYKDGYIPWIKPDNITDEFKVTDSKEKLSYEGAKQARLIPKNSALVCCIGTVGKVGINEVECATNQQINSIIFDKEIWENKFGIYTLIASRQEHERNSSKVVVSILNKSQQGNIYMPITNINEQEKIANFLDEKTSQFDLIISKKEKLIERLEEAKKSLISEVVTGKVKVVKSDDGYELVKRSSDDMKDSGVEWIGCIPIDFKTVRLGLVSFVTKIAGFEYTDHMADKLSNIGEVPIVRAGNIKMNRFIDQEKEFIDIETSKKLNRCALYQKCVLMTFIGAGIGEVALFDKKQRHHLAPNVAKIEILAENKLKIDEQYLIYYLMSNSGQEEVNKIKKASAQPSLSMETIRNIKIVLPNLEQQYEINQYLNLKIKEIDRVINKTKLQIEKLKEAKQSLISEAVTGKIEILD